MREQTTFKFLKNFFSEGLLQAYSNDCERVCGRVQLYSMPHGSANMYKANPFDIDQA